MSVTPPRPSGASPFISVIVPFHDAARHLEVSLPALLASTHEAFEVIAVDDGSSDDSARLCREREIAVVSLPSNSGPAAARNEGVKHCRGELLLFLDADVVVRPDTLQRIAGHLRDSPETDALFGSYDAAPPERNLVSQYKNLLHHFVHQQASADAFTFWAGCGAVRRPAFEQAGGFDARRYPRPSIEDIELGRRLKRLGYTIRLDRTLQVTHLKRWTWREWLRTDILRRAAPWSLLILEDRQAKDDLNLKAADRLSAAVAGASLLSLVGALAYPALLIASVAGLLLVYALNAKLFRFFRRQRGRLFEMKCLPLHFLYYLYSGVTFVLCTLSFIVRPRRAP